MRTGNYLCCITPNSYTIISLKTHKWTEIYSDSRCLGPKSSLTMATQYGPQAWVSWKRKYLSTNNSIIYDPSQDFDTQSESTLTTHFHLKIKEFILTRFRTLETIKREEVEQTSNSLRSKYRNSLSAWARARNACYLERQYCSKIPETCFSSSC